MRLVKVDAGEKLSLIEFFGNNIPPYAILSHTWGSNGDEVSFEDLVNQTGNDKIGYAKIEFCGRRASADGLQYFWVDTCCIDKSSSAELTEAINSMFQWYRNAAKCYVYLSDVSIYDFNQADRLRKSVFQQCRWFSRGWTLQELIAPTGVEFFSHEGEHLGDKKSLEKEIIESTEINVLALRGYPLSNFTVADQMSWAAKRTTTREEDNAYCLLGIFGVYMPLIYGEGRRAFTGSSKRSTSLRKVNEFQLLGAASDAVSPSSSQALQRPELDRAELVQWMRSHNPYTNHLAAQRKKQAHTGSWFLRGSQYSQWKGGLTPLLWVAGSPGSGKTVLCSTIIENLREYSTMDTSAMMAYYYFDFSEADKLTLDSFIRSIIVQLTANLPEIPQDLSSLHASCKESKQEPPIESLKQVLRNILMRSSKTIIVIDALDECSQSEELVQFIGEMISWGGSKLRLLVVSRQHFEGADALEELRPSYVSIQDEVANNDILTFVQEILSKDVKLRNWPPQVKKEIQTALVSKSNGMFRWVACQTDMLKKCRRQQDVDTVLLSLPPTLEETYDRILDAIDDTFKQDVRAVLQWLAFSERPLRLEEVVEIVAFDGPDVAFDVDRSLLNPQEILTMCSSLVVSNETYYYDYERNNVLGHERAPITELRLAHFTVKDYLLSPSLKESRHSYYSIEEKTSSLQISKSCLSYLTMDEFSSGFQGRRIQDRRLNQWPLLDYAADFCGVHLRNVENDLDVTTRNLIQKLMSSHKLPNGGNFGTLVRTKWRFAPLDLIQTTEPLYFASSHGLVSVVRLLLSDAASVDIEAKGGRYGSTSLQVASYRGNTDCVRLLLAAGADPNAPNDLGETPLLWANKIGADEIVHSLLRYGARR
ncbi:hypothetical protein ACEPPN_011922 [Leptodophora sp. 'Broadleaf-Isolate-01']